MRRAIPAVLLVLAALASMGAVACLLRMPSACFVGRPERVIHAAILISCVLAVFWALSGIQLLKFPRHQVGPFLRVSAWLVLTIGSFLWLGSRTVSLACVLSAVIVLCHGKGANQG